MAFFVTNEWMMAFSTSEKTGAWTKVQIDALMGPYRIRARGMWQPPKGWRRKIIGTEITEEQRLLFETGQHMIASRTFALREKRARRAKRQDS